MASAEMTIEIMANKVAEDFQNAIRAAMTEKYTPKKIIKSGDVTIVFWLDNSKTIVRRDPEDADNLHTAFCAALAKKIFGSNSHIKKTIARKLVENKKEKKA